MHYNIDKGYVCYICSYLYLYSPNESLQKITQAPEKYSNRLLEMVSQRHTLSVNMLTYIFENDFESETIWNLIEDYFLGEIPEKVKESCIKAKPKINFN